VKHILLFGLSFLILNACNKELGGPRKLTAVGHFEYSSATNLVTQVYYTGKDDERAITIRLNRNNSISGDVDGTWANSGAQISMIITGDFGPASPFSIDHGYYETKPKVAVQGHEVTMADFVTDTYFIVVTKGTIGTTNYERHFVFE